MAAFTRKLVCIRCFSEGSPLKMSIKIKAVRPTDSNECFEMTEAAGYPKRELSFHV